MIQPDDYIYFQSSNSKSPNQIYQSFKYLTIAQGNMFVSDAQEVYEKTIMIKWYFE